MPQAASRSVAEHRDAILASLAPLPPVETPLDHALGLVLAEDVHALVDVPGFDNSAMDGYAVRRADVVGASPGHPVVLEVVADLPAGSGDDPAVPAGSAARIMTGAPVPADADAIVPVEDTDGGTDRVTVRAEPAPAAFVRRAGSDVRRGDRVLAAGRTLTSRDLAAAAATGLASLPVHPAPQVGVLSTGTELAEPGAPLTRGRIHDSNAVLLAGLLAEAGCVAVPLGAVADDEGALVAALERASGLDAVVTSGGVSVGAYDVVKAVLAPLGVWFGPVRMQPGKPQGYGRLPGGIPVFCLPGNPVSVAVSFEAFLRPAMRALQGRADLVRPVTRAAATEGWTSPRGRAQYMPVRASDAGVAPASPGGSGSHLAASLAAADGFAIVPEDVTEVRTGDVLDVTLLS